MHYTFIGNVLKTFRMVKHRCGMINIVSMHLFSQIFRDAPYTLLHLLCLLTKHNTYENKSFSLKEQFTLNGKFCH